MSVYACSDLHGMLNLYEQITNFISPSDKVYFLGDAVDRGHNGWELLKLIYYNPQFIYLKGNHEDMFVKSAFDIEYNGIYGNNYNLHLQNGGEGTIIDWEKENNRAEWISKIDKLSMHEKYKNKDGVLISLTHAGYTPKYCHEGDILWGRDHFLDEWDEKNFDRMVCVHGHTPIPLLMGDLKMDNTTWELGAFWYCNNHKVCIDNGSVWTNTTCLLDLDTFDEHVFQV